LIEDSYFNTGWAVGMVKSVAKEESVAGQFAVKYKTGTLSWTDKISKEDSGIDKYWVPFLKTCC
jgi:hypothetical protein